MMTSEVEKRDLYITFPSRKARRMGQTPSYWSPTLLKVEDIVGFKLTYDRPLNEEDIKYLRRRRRELIENICNHCYRMFPTEQPQQVQDVRVTKVAIPEECEKYKRLITDLKVKRVPLNCEGCRVLRLKQVINQETKWRYLKLRSGSVIKSRGLPSPMPIYSGSNYLGLNTTVQFDGLSEEEE